MGMLQWLAVHAQYVPMVERLLLGQALLVIRFLTACARRTLMERVPRSVAKLAMLATLQVLERRHARALPASLYLQTHPV